MAMESYLESAIGYFYSEAKGKVTLVQSTKAQRGSCSIDVLLL
jgi:hypothetical protein